MGRTYSVPRNVKGETRLLYIFSIKSCGNLFFISVIDAIFNLFL